MDEIKDDDYTYDELIERFYKNLNNLCREFIDIEKRYGIIPIKPKKVLSQEAQTMFQSPNLIFAFISRQRQRIDSLKANDHCE